MNQILRTVSENSASKKRSLFCNSEYFDNQANLSTATCNLEGKPEFGRRRPPRLPCLRVAHNLQKF